MHSEQPHIPFCLCSNTQKYQHRIGIHVRHPKWYIGQRPTYHLGSFSSKSKFWCRNYVLRWCSSTATSWSICILCCAKFVEYNQHARNKQCTHANFQRTSSVWLWICSMSACADNPLHQFESWYSVRSSRHSMSMILWRDDWLATTFWECMHAKCAGVPAFEVARCTGTNTWPNPRNLHKAVRNARPNIEKQTAYREVFHEHVCLMQI